jgi:hypothetical protein
MQNLANNLFNSIKSNISKLPIYVSAKNAFSGHNEFKKKSKDLY